jgi:hypothetical protein
MCADVTVSAEAPRPFEAMRGFVPYVAKPITLDGKLDEWTARQSTMVLKKSTINAIGRVDGDITDDADLAVTLWLAWDRKNLYVAVDVVDQALISGPREVGSDGVVLGLVSARYPALARADSGLQYCLNYYFPGAPAPSPGGKGRYVVEETKTGYRMEAALPFAGMGIEPSSGLRLNWYLITIDRDLHKCGRLLGLGTWDAQRGKYTHAELRLLPAQTADFSGDLTIDTVQVKPGEALEARAEVDARRDGEISEARIEDAHGAVKWRSAITVPLKAGTILPVRLRIHPPALPTGAYRLVVRYGKGKARAEMAASFRVY